MSSKGLMIVISGPAGTGKGTVVKELVKDDNFRLSISATTRAPRGTEQNGVEYHFLSREEFERLIENNGFFEYAEYLGNYYGSPKQPVIDWTQEGRDVILEIEVQGCEKVKKVQPDCISIFIKPPSEEVLEHRLRKRGTETEENIQKRLARAREELPKADEYDYVVINDGLEECVEEIKNIIRSEKQKS